MNDSKRIVRIGRYIREKNHLDTVRAVRPLVGLTLQDTADRYLAIARQVLGLRVGLR